MLVLAPVSFGQNSSVGTYGGAGGSVAGSIVSNDAGSGPGATASPTASSSSGGLPLTGLDGPEFPTYTITGLDPDSAVVPLELYRRQGAWKVRAVGQGYAGGLAELFTDQGLPEAGRLAGHINEAVAGSLARAVPAPPQRTADGDRARQTAAPTPGPAPQSAPGAVSRDQTSPYAPQASDTPGQPTSSYGPPGAPGPGTPQVPSAADPSAATPAANAPTAPAPDWPSISSWRAVLAGGESPASESRLPAFSLARW